MPGGAWLEGARLSLLASGYGKGVFTVMSIAPAVSSGQGSHPLRRFRDTRMRISKSSPKPSAYAAKI